MKSGFFADINALKWAYYPVKTDRYCNVDPYACRCAKCQFRAKPLANSNRLGCRNGEPYDCHCDLIEAPYSMPFESHCPGGSGVCRANRRMMDCKCPKGRYRGTYFLDAPYFLKHT